MKTNTRILSIVLLLAIIVFVSSSATSAQEKVKTAATGDPSSKTQGAIEPDIDQLIENILGLIDKRFVDIPVGKKVIAEITKYHKNGKYRALKSDLDFAVAINRDLFALSNDRHLVVSTNDPGDQSSTGPRRVVAQPGSDAGSEERRMLGRLFERPANGFFSSEILDGNIGYFKVNGLFAPLEDKKVREDMESAMLKLRDADAVIFDIRKVRGGVPETISLLSSYLYDDKPKHMNTYHNRLTGSTKLYTRPDEVPFNFGLALPLYFLINSGTGSAAEAFAYHNQQHGRVTVIGEKSVGAGRLSSPHPISETLYFLVPENESEHPVSKTGFEQVGVIPDIKASSSESLIVAHTTALNNLIKNNNDNSKWKTALSMVSEKNETAKTLDEKKIAASGLGEYAGVYGERSIVLSGEGIAYKRGGQPEIALEEIRKDFYKIVVPAGAMVRGPVPTVRFDRDEAGKVTSMSLVADDGSVMGTYTKGQ